MTALRPPAAPTLPSAADRYAIDRTHTFCRELERAARLARGSLDCQTEELRAETFGQAIDVALSALRDVTGEKKEVSQPAPSRA